MSNLSKINASIPGGLQAATTQAIVVSDLAAAIAVVGVQQGPDDAISGQGKRRIGRVGERLVVAVSGAYAVADASGVMTFNLLDSAPMEAQRLTWVDSQGDAYRLALAIRRQLSAMERSPFRGIPKTFVNPNVSILVTGIDAGNRVFAARIRIAGKLLGFGGVRTIGFLDPVVEMIVPSPGKFRIVLETRDEALERRAKEISSARDPQILKYEGLWSLGQPRPTLDEQTVRSAAGDLVQFAIDNDVHVNGPIEVQSVRVASASG